MSPAKRPRKKNNKKRSFVEQLESGESRELLHRLLVAHPELRREAERMARGLLGEVTYESIAEEVQYDVEFANLEALNSRAGRDEWGYTEPTEAAWELLQEAVEPYLEDMQRHIDLKLEKQALEICKGIILGLYRVRAGKSGGRSARDVVHIRSYATPVAAGRERSRARTLGVAGFAVPGGDGRGVAQRVAVRLHAVIAGEEWRVGAGTPGGMEPGVGRRASFRLTYSLSVSVLPATTAQPPDRS